MGRGWAWRAKSCAWKRKALLARPYMKGCLQRTGFQNCVLLLTEDAAMRTQARSSKIRLRDCDKRIVANHSVCGGSEGQLVAFLGRRRACISNSQRDTPRGDQTTSTLQILNLRQARNELPYNAAKNKQGKRQGKRAKLPDGVMQHNVHSVTQESPWVR